MKKLKCNTLFFLLLLLGACAHAPEQGVARVGKSAASEQNKVVLPNLALTQKMLYELLLADVAAQRGESGLAARTYLDMAHSSRDPRLARYATQLAYEARQMDEAMEAVKLWRELEPDSVLAEKMLVSMLLGSGKLDEARPHLAGLLATDTDNVDVSFMQMYLMLARLPDRMRAFDLMNELALPYPRVAEARWVVAQLAEAADKHELALEEAQKAYNLRPEWDRAVILKAQLLQDKAPQQALSLLKEYLATYPDVKEVRVLYARLLTGKKQYQDARAQYQLLLDANPDSPDYSFAVALLSLELGDVDRAEKGLVQALTNGKKDGNAVYYYLGQLNETKKNDDEALQNYRKVMEGEYAFSADLRTAFLLGKAGKLDEARQAMRQADAKNDQQRVQLVMFEAQLLRDAQQQQEAYQLLVQGLEKFPDHQELLYETAMLADMIGKHEAFEDLIRKLIQIKPDYAHSYNALGYSFLDRNERVEEGMRLVEKAYQLAPDDAAIIDSVGWGYYRLGNLPKSVEFLRRAYTANPEPEIAAHLGEVLWMKGDKDEATKVWQQALKEHPDNAVLTTVVKKFLP